MLTQRGLLRLSWQSCHDCAAFGLYDDAALDRLSRIRLLRELGTPLAELDPDAHDLRELARRHVVDLDARLAELARMRERVRAVEDLLLRGDRPGDQALLDLLSGLTADEPALTRRITLLVYRDISAGHAYLVDVLGLAAGPISYDGDRAVHGEVYAGDGVVWLHPEAPEHRMASPSTTGMVTASIAVVIDDVDAHHSRVAATGATINYPPTDMPYGVREYSVRDPEGHLWSFQTPLTEIDGLGTA